MDDATSTSDRARIEERSELLRPLGLHLEELGPARVSGWADLDQRHHQPFGIVHGGVHAALVESAASMGATAAAMERDLVAVGVHNSTNFLASMSEGRVRVVAEPITQGRTQQLWNVTITRESDGRLVATGQVRLQNVTPR